MPNPSVLIVGAGPTGLVLALWLTKFGIRVRIIDKTAEPGTTSRAVGVQARTLELYRQLDLDEAVIAGSVKVHGVNMWVGGQQRARLNIHRMGEGLSPYPYIYMYAQDVHERFLIEQLAAAGVTVERQTELVRFEQDANAVRAVLRRPDGSEETCTAAYLAGCDGASSIVRKSLGIEFPGGTYTGLFYVADVEAQGPAANGEAHVELDQADFLAVFPLQGRGRMRLIGAVNWDQEQQQREMTFADVSPRAMQNLQLQINKVHWFSTYRVHHRVAEHFRVGRAFLLGDAAHIHSPAGGQGMNTGIGDAINLAWKLAAVIQNRASAPLLETFEPERIVFARRLVATTDRIFTLVTKQGFFARVVRTRLFPRLAAFLFRFAPIRRLMFRTISQIAINYRGSSLSAGTAGALRGGDRLPWVETGCGADNFTALSPPEWQVHIYGEMRFGLAECCAELDLPLARFDWMPAMSDAGLVREAMYLVRPDSYLALVDPQADPEVLSRYFADRGMTPSASNSQ
jgi:2-polyprenyl-6-methoxyphenol hydroxylase-like FAD-dependent oxidoreductase